MNKKLLFLLMLFAGMANAQTVAIPDPAFKAKLIALGVDANSDGNIQNSEALAVTLLVMKDANIAHLDGIEAFTNLTLLDCNFNLLSSLNVSGLTQLVTLNCYSNQISLLNVSGLTNLKTINCGANVLNSLNTAGLTNLESLELSVNKFTSFNASGLSNLKHFGIGNNPLTSFAAVTGLPNTLESLSVHALSLTALNVTTFPNLKELNCGQNQLGNFSAITGLTSNLENLYCDSNQFTTMNVSMYTNLKILSCSYNLLTALNVSGLTNLETLYCRANQLTALNVSTLTNLVTLIANDNLITSLNVTGLSHLKYLYSYNNPLTLNLTGPASLEYLTCSYDQLATFDFSQLTNLTTLYIYGGTGGTNLTLTGMNNITELNCSKLGLTSIDLSAMPNLKTLICAENALISLNLSGLPRLETLGCRSNLLTALDLSALPNLKYLDCATNQLASLNTSSLPNLKQLYCGSNLLTSLNIANNGNLENLDVQFNNLTGLDVSNAPNLTTLNCYSNQITGLNLTINSKLSNIVVAYNQLTSLQLNPEILNLRYLHYANNPLPNFDFSTYTELVGLELSNTGRTAIDVSRQTKLFTLNCSGNPIPTIDVSNNYKLTDFSCGNPALTQLFMKNGANENFTIADSPNLRFVCTDEQQTLNVQTKITESGNTNCVVNSYCTFVPGGNYNTITGNMLFDANNNGCDANDIQQPNIKIRINDGTSTGSTFTNTTGTYHFYTLTGNFAIAPETENPGYFNFSPATATIPFINNDDNVVNQGFCITANGIHPDLEIAIAPIGTARPGFDATYKLVYKNIGNQTLSGNVAFGFNDAVLDLVNASVAPDAVATSLLTWNYTNLLPFESRSYTITLNVNSPTETPAVNLNEILVFTANGNPVLGDENPLNNQFTLNQLVVGSYDPNDITCLEGNVVSPDAIGNYLHYIVNFENTGTVAAENVVVKLVVDPQEFDINSLQLMNSSHGAFVEIRNNIVEFKFANINLQPSAGDPPVNGHGNILFKLKSKATLDTGDLVKNRANIFFDYNFPVETNDAETTFRVLSTDIFANDASAIVFPNPTKDKININCNNTIKSIELYDIQGRILEVFAANKISAQIDLSDKSKGIYFVKIITEKGKKLQKVIKE